VLSDKVLSVDAVSLRDCLDQRSTLILLQQHEFPECVDVGLRQGMSINKCELVNNVFSDVPLKN